MLTRDKIAIIHVAKKQLDLDDETYREVIETACGKGVRSASQIRDNIQFIALMGKFTELGFVPTTKNYRRNPGYRKAEWATPEQLEKIVAMWKTITRYPDKWSLTLDSFLSKRFKCPRLNALARWKAQSVIEALKNMQERQNER